MSHGMSVAIKSLLKGLFSQTIVDFFWFAKGPWARSFFFHTVHICLVHHSCLKALLFKRAFVLDNAVAAWLLFFCIGGLQNLCIMASDLILHIAHGRVGDFDCVTVDYSVQRMSLRKMLSHEV